MPSQSHFKRQGRKWRSERMFRTHQGRLPLELADAGITTMKAANRRGDGLADSG